MKNKVFYLLVASLLSMALMPAIRTFAGDMNYPPLNGNVRLVLLGLFAVSFALLGCFIHLEFASGSKTDALQKTLFFSLLIGIILLWADPVFSVDIRCYIMQGRVMSIHGANPYLVPLDAFSGDPFMKDIFWTHTVAFYGPAWILISAFAAFLAGNSPMLNIVLMKLPALGAYLLMIWQGYSLASKICPKRKNVVAAFLAFNPFILAQYLVDGHNDLLMFALALTAVNLIYEKRFIPGYIVFTVSVLVKYTSAAITPFLLFMIYERVEDNAEFFKQLAFFALSSLVVAVALYFPFMDNGPEFFRNFMGHKLMGAKGVDTNTIPYAMLMLAQKAGALKGVDITEPPKFILNVFHLLFVASAGAMLIKGWLNRDNMLKLFSAITGIFMAYFVFEAFSFGAWFLIWMLPFLLLSDIKRATLLAFLISLAGAVSFWKRLSFVLMGCVCVYFIVIFVSGITREKPADV